MRVAERMSMIGTETAFEVSARARALEAEGRDIIHLQIGEPDFDTPANIREAAKKALDEGATHYAPYPGIPPLRAAIAEDAQARKGFPVTPDRVFVTVGGKGVMLYAILGLIDPGDEVLVPDPGYPIYESLTRFVGGTPVPVPIRMEHDFRLDLAELASLVAMYGQLVINTISCAPTFAQVGAVEAIRGPQEPMAEMVDEFRVRRDLVVDGLNAIPGIRCLSPKGAFYAFPDISGTGLTGKELADRLLLESGVCVLAGTAFGGIATNHIRVSYANSRENLTKALGRIGEFVAGLPSGAAAASGAAASGAGTTAGAAR